MSSILSSFANFTVLIIPHIYRGRSFCLFSWRGFYVISTLFQMNWSMKKRNIRTLLTRWTKLSPNFLASKLHAFVINSSQIVNVWSYIIYKCLHFRGRHLSYVRMDSFIFSMIVKHCASLYRHCYRPCCAFLPVYLVNLSMS